MKINTWHLRHPWQLPSKNGLRSESLSLREKRISLIALVLGLPFFLGGVIAFYAVSYYFKTRHVKKLPALSPPVQKVQDQATEHLTPPKIAPLPTLPIPTSVAPPSPPLPSPTTAAPSSPPPLSTSAVPRPSLPPSPGIKTPPVSHPPSKAARPQTPVGSPFLPSGAPSLFAPSLFASQAVGEMKGFHGDSNSSGICAILYSLFATTSAFDFLWKGDDPIRASLRHIVLTFRSESYVPSSDIEILRQHICPSTGDPGEFFKGLFSKLNLSIDEHFVAPKNFGKSQTSTQALISERSSIGPALMLYIPLEGKGQAIPQPEIEVKSSKGPVKMRLASIIIAEDTSPFVSFSFDEKGNGYAFDSMARVDKNHIPVVRELKGLLDKLQKQNDPQRILSNLRACIYVK